MWRVVPLSDRDVFVIEIPDLTDGRDAVHIHHRTSPEGSFT
jgi:hypothetical protein